MQGALLLSLLADEIDEIGRRLAQLIGPGSAVARGERSRVRALLREAFQLAQAGRPDPDDGGDAPGSDDPGGDDEDAASPADEGTRALALIEMLERLREALRDLGGVTPGPLEERLSARSRFGAIDQPLVERNANFSTVGLRCAEGWSDVLDARIERTLATLTEVPDESEEGAMVRPIRTQEEARELILSKLE